MNQLQALVSSHHIKAHNIWNFDEKGFMIGICQASKRIVTAEALERGYIKGTMQDGSREFISLLAAVSALGNVMPPTLLFASETGDLLDNWLDEIDELGHRAYFGASPNGWTSHELSLAWLDRFHEFSFTISGYQKRLLIIDGHSSHVSMEFLTKAIDYNILIAVLPPHCTHRLQPLDVSVFRPLANYYSQGLDEYIRRSLGVSRVSKKAFLSIFWPAWDKALRYETISSGFRKAGIYPFDPSIVLDQVRPIDHSSSSEDTDNEIKQPTNVREVRNLIKSIHQEQPIVSKNVTALCKAMEAIILENDILRHKSSQLNEALLEKANKRKRGKAIGLLVEGEPKYGQIWSPVKLAARREEIELETRREEQKKHAKAEIRVQRQLQRETQAQERREAIENRRRERAELKAVKEAGKLHQRRQREIKKALKTTKIRPQKPPSRFTIGRKKSQRPSRVENTINRSSEVPITIARSGRTVSRPARFLE
jgi:hypothetical protein